MVADNAHLRLLLTLTAFELRGPQSRKSIKISKTDTRGREGEEVAWRAGEKAVDYTHLTLPTKSIAEI